MTKDRKPSQPMMSLATPRTTTPRTTTPSTTTPSTALTEQPMTMYAMTPTSRAGTDSAAHPRSRTVGRLGRGVGSVGCALGVLLAVTSCGSNGGSPAAGATTRTRGGQFGNQAGGGLGRGVVAGTIAAINGKTMQVQGNAEQVAVTYTATTAILTDATASAAALKVGQCVMALSPPTAPSGAPTSAPPSSAPSPEPTITTATTVRLFPPTGGACLGGAGGFPGGRMSTATNPPTPRTDGPDQRPGRFGAVRGTITTVGPDRFTVTVPARTGGPGAPATSPTAPAGTAPTSTAPTSVTVTFTPATVFTLSRATTAKTLRVGACVTGNGTPDETGSITATTLTVAAPVNGQCQAFGLRGNQTGSTGG